MQIYIISIEALSSPRWVQFTQQPFIALVDSHFEKIGIIGSEISSKQYFNQAVKGRSQPLTPGELGCTLSHLQALKQFLATEDDYALILEDDAIIPTDLTSTKLETELKCYNLPKNILFSIGGIKMKECLKVRGRCMDRFLDQKVLAVVPEYYHRACYAFAYVVDRAMAKTLLDYHQEVRKADDWSYLYDFDPSVHLYMTDLVQHPDIHANDMDPLLSHLEGERKKSTDLKKSAYGTTIQKNLAKLLYQKY